MSLQPNSPSASKPDGTNSTGGVCLPTHGTTAPARVRPAARPFSFSFADLTSQSPAKDTGGASPIAHPDCSAFSPALPVSSINQRERFKRSIKAYQTAQRVDRVLQTQFQLEC